MNGLSDQFATSWIETLGLPPRRQTTFKRALMYHAHSCPTNVSCN
jgi:hypothetical protein